MELFTFNKIIFKEEYSVLYKIREIRNEISGHPIGSSYGKVYSSFNPHMFNGFIFSYFVRTEHNSEIKNINILELILDQKKETEIILEIIIKNIMKKEQDFKEIKDKQNLLDIFDEHTQIYYMVGKLYSHNDTVSKSFFVDSLIERLDRIEALLKNKFDVKSVNDLIDSEGVKYLIPKIKEILKRIKDANFKDNFELDIYVNTLSKEFDNLREVLEYIDKQ